MQGKSKYKIGDVVELLKEYDPAGIYSWGSKYDRGDLGKITDVKYDYVLGAYEYSIRMNRVINNNHTILKLSDDEVDTWFRLDINSSESARKNTVVVSKSLNDWYKRTEPYVAKKS